jgi:hypothetical protein
MTSMPAACSVLTIVLNSLTDATGAVAWSGAKKPIEL